MSILIDELEARKNDYILVADVINAMSNATNSAPDEVVKYLDAHNIDEHMPLLYMDESYTFEPYNGHILGLGNDANITYYQKSDVMAFEPITKHGIFDDKQTPLVNDIYGRTYDINQYKKNREDEYLTLAETLNLLNYNADINSPSYDHVKLRDLARKRLITPCFYFCGYVGSFGGDSSKVLKTEIMTGYFSYRLLVEEIYNYDDYMKLPNNGVMIYRVLEKQTAEYVDYDDVFLFYDKPQGLDEAEKFKLTHMESEEIRFSKQELGSYIASLTNTSQDDTPAHNDSELLTKLETTQVENNDLNARLFTARNTYKQNQNEIKELKAQLEKANAESADLKEQLSNKIDAPADDNTLQTILNESHDYHAPDLKHAIQLWIDLYVNDGIKSDSHSNKAAQWISRNTDYAENAKTSTDRIKEISSPSKYWSPHRKKEV
ncbi:MAG: coiled-coil domain-containing protein [Psychrobacter sp.]|uniref:coiled-coil domain-containing protein n=1 Tax=Psychrobacter sp. AOP7-B1-24 TaxID=3457645 RepID=UPI003FB703CE